MDINNDDDDGERGQNRADRQDAVRTNDSHFQTVEDLHRVHYRIFSDQPSLKYIGKAS